MGVKFNCTTIDGTQIEIKTPTKDAMIAALENPQTSQEKKELATEILNWYSAQSAKPPLLGNTELDRAAQLMGIEFDSSRLWDGSYRLVTKTANGVTSKVLEAVEPVA
jgi:hypothetical protein